MLPISRNVLILRNEAMLVGGGQAWVASRGVSLRGMSRVHRERDDAALADAFGVVGMPFASTRGGQDYMHWATLPECPPQAFPSAQA